MGQIHPDIEAPYLHAMAGSLLYQVNVVGVVSEKHFDDRPISCVDLQIHRMDVQVLDGRASECFVRNDGDAWLRVYLTSDGRREYDVPVLQSMTHIPEEDDEVDRGWPHEWIRTDWISLWYEGQRLLVC